MPIALTPAEQHVDHVLATLRKQRAKGRAKYGKGLDHRDAYDWRSEALQELADAVQYLCAENLRLRDLLRSTLPHTACPARPHTMPPPWMPVGLRERIEAALEGE